jgi:hypothetical protein
MLKIPFKLMDRLALMMTLKNYEDMKTLIHERYVLNIYF